ncbi:MAG: AtpZ/AtpI family protein [Burkholderiales bacterium]
MPEGDDKQLRKAVEREAGRLQRAERERSRLIAQTVYLGSLALMFVVPVVAGAYLGRWIDGMFAGYSIRFTVSLIVLGVAIGAVNVYLFVRERR